MDRESFRTLISEWQHDAEAALVRGDVGPTILLFSFVQGRLVEGLTAGAIKEG